MEFMSVHTWFLPVFFSEAVNTKQYQQLIRLLISILLPARWNSSSYYKLSSGIGVSQEFFCIKVPFMQRRTETKYLAMHFSSSLQSDQRVSYSIFFCTLRSSVNRLSLYAYCHIFFCPFPHSLDCSQTSL